MIGTRYEDYGGLPSESPFVLRIGLERTQYKRSSEMNWHEDPEIQLCTDGEGTVLLNGEKYDFRGGDFVVVNPNEIHYTGTDGRLVYTCLIVKSGFCRQMGIDCNVLQFSSHFRSDRLFVLFGELEKTYRRKDVPLRTARLNDLVLRILIELAESYSIPRDKPIAQSRQFETVKAAVRYIRENYHRKLSLDEISGAVCVNKYSLCREFKAFTGQTVVEHLNGYRCLRAAESLSEGAAVSTVAEACGFENLSFFTKTFKKHMNVLPSQWKEFRREGGLTKFSELKGKSG